MVLALGATPFEWGGLYPSVALASQAPYAPGPGSLATAHREHRAKSEPEQAVGHAPHQKPPETRAPVSRPSSWKGPRRTDREPPADYWRSSERRRAGSLPCSQEPARVMRRTLAWTPLSSRPAARHDDSSRCRSSGRVALSTPPTPAVCRGSSRMCRCPVSNSLHEDTATISPRRPSREYPMNGAEGCSCLSSSAASVGFVVPGWAATGCPVSWRQPGRVEPGSPGCEDGEARPSFP